MSAFSGLLTEILQVIILELENGLNRKPLRCICKGLSAVVEPVLFLDIVISTHCSALEMVSIPLCKALGGPQDDVVKSRSLSTYVRTLTVCDRTWSMGDDNVGREVLDAFSLLHSQSLFTWVLSGEYFVTCPVAAALMKAKLWAIAGKLPDLPSLSEFTLAGDLGLGAVHASETPLAIPLDRLYNLHTLVIDARWFHLPGDDFNQNVFESLSTALRTSPNLQTLRAPFTNSKPLFLRDLFRSILDTKGLGASVSALPLTAIVMGDPVMEIPAAIALHLRSLTSLEISQSRNVECGNLWDVLCMAHVTSERLIADCDIDRSLCWTTSCSAIRD
ncbi:hypothetical protein D9758_011409 [Tetrapyrgos nigripes]|uniref:Uncharacterized protein n=1 Tax=Tetrapyrgos nigripes TaxID=182062 RepID=A0A8H5CQ45_9AGAR|nr:hypothetical protein D9758_011409 [Tetrapyrgos nigripes]